MLGTAGIGLHFLRLHDAEHVPCPLWTVRGEPGHDDPQAP